MKKIFLIIPFLFFFILSCSKQHKNIERVIKAVPHKMAPIVYFDFNQTHINPDRIDPLYEVVGDMKKYPSITKVYVEGFSSFKEKNKLKLSQKRAEVIVQYLVDKMNLERQRLEPIGYGDLYPLDTEDTPEGRARNSRVEFNVDLRSTK